MSKNSHFATETDYVDQTGDYFQPDCPRCQPINMNCDRCNRQVEGTVHTRDEYRVELYRLFTGDAVPVVFKEGVEEQRKFSKIEQPATVTLCNDCYHVPVVREALERFESPLDGL